MDHQPRIVELRRNILKDNDLKARVLRERFAGNGVFVVSLVSSPGSGKTTLLERVLTILSKKFKVAALVGDLATDNDCRRLQRSGVPVHQITTGTVCHLDASMIERSIAEWDLASLDFLFIENVGNLVCPAAYDLGESFRIVLFSVTEGEDKPLKYPTIFHTADAVVISKVDLAQAVEFDEAAALANIDAARPDVKVFKVSARTGEGVEAFLTALCAKAQGESV